MRLLIYERERERERERESSTNKRRQTETAGEREGEILLKMRIFQKALILKVALIGWKYICLSHLHMTAR